ncbi:MAG: integration host factor subunit alpha [Bdellovibrionales bacterium]|nr:integration host factor subunit alpha [Bdellovibrionales bacterium]
MKKRSHQTLKKSDLVNSVYNKIGYSKKHGESVIDSFFNIIKESLNEGVGVKINKFGKFILKDKRARPGRNPRTGENLTISPRRVILFHASSNLKKLFKP